MAPSLNPTSLQETKEDYPNSLRETVLEENHDSPSTRIINSDCFPRDNPTEISRAYFSLLVAARKNITSSVGLPQDSYRF